MFNFSTGRVINKTVFDSEVTSMDHDHAGNLIFCGDGQVSSYIHTNVFSIDMFNLCNLLSTGLCIQGCVYSVTMNSRSGALSRAHRYRSSTWHKSPVTTVQYRSFSLLAGGPVLLACSQDGNLSFFRFNHALPLTF